MSHVTVGRWGGSLAIRIPLDVSQAAGLTGGESLDIRTEGDNIVIHRPELRSQTEARLAAEEIIAERERFTLDDLGIRQMLEDGRRE